MDSYDEKTAYKQRCRKRQSHHIKHDSYDSKSSVSSSESSIYDFNDEEKYNEAAPPKYAHVFYNTIDDKPLPPLPTSHTRRVRFMVRTKVVVDKPLPPLPRENHTRKRSDSGSGEYVWWSKRFEMSDREYENLAREKEMS